MSISPEIGVMFRREQHPADLPSYAQRAEHMGFDQLWIVEDCFYLGGISQAAIALASTSRIKVGIGINPGVAHRSAILAMEYATLARAYPGRLIGGIGHGVAEWMEQIGVKPESPLTSIQEITSNLRALLRGERVTFEGRYVHLRDVELHVAPESVPPVLLGVVGEKSLRLAGRCADGVILIENSGPAYVRWARSLMNGARRGAGIQGPGQVIVYTNCLVSERDPDSAKSTMRDIVAKINGSTLHPTIAPASFAGQMKALIEEGGADALRQRMPDSWLHELALTGSHEDASKSVARLAQAGADAVVLVPPENVNWDDWLADQQWATRSSRT
jgi:alkanesulfonate monooxygenase SsuD/methylene tetrahydromethanopterin reductase-like flavin-dependent oxidoreductase (luciferase family)